MEANRIRPIVGLDVATLINALAMVATGLYGEEAWNRARMRGFAEAVAVRANG